MAASTFPMKLVPETAWLLRSALRPGILFTWPPNSPQEVIENTVRPLRRKINNAILRMLDEKVKTITIDCTEQEAWTIDDRVNFDGPGGPGTDLIIQLLRGLWWLDIGQHLTAGSDLVDDPFGGWDNKVFRNIPKSLPQANGNGS